MWWIVKKVKHGLKILSSKTLPVEGTIEGTQNHPGQWGGDMVIRKTLYLPKHNTDFYLALLLRRKGEKERPNLEHKFTWGRLYLITADPVPKGTYRPHKVSRIKKSKELPLWIGDYCTEEFYNMIKEIR